MKWKVEELVKHAGETHSLVRGKWVPARPLNPRTFKEKLSEVIQVWKGTVDIVEWIEK